MLNTNIMLMGVYKDMISYYTPLLGPLKSMAGQNTSQFLGGSICSFFRGCGCILRLDFLGVTVGMIVTVGFFIIMDWWTGMLRHILKQLLLETKGIWMNTKSTE
jgi:hypothetical protein